MRLTWTLDEGDKTPFSQLYHLRQLYFIRHISHNKLRVIRFVAIVGEQWVVDVILLLCEA